MKNELLEEIVVVEGKPGDWPTEFVITDHGTYQYTGQTFAFYGKTCPKGKTLPLPINWQDRMIKEIRGDGECSVILLRSGNKVVFDLSHDPFEGNVISYPCVSFQSLEESRSWEDDFTEMPIMLI